MRICSSAPLGPMTISSTITSPSLIIKKPQEKIVPFVTLRSSWSQMRSNRRKKTMRWKGSSYLRRHQRMKDRREWEEFALEICRRSSGRYWKDRTRAVCLVLSRGDWTFETIEFYCWGYCSTMANHFDLCLGFQCMITNHSNLVMSSYKINDRISFAGLFWLSRKEYGRVGLLRSWLSSTLICLTSLLVEQYF